jgi:hypothetical protein
MADQVTLAVHDQRIIQLERRVEDMDKKIESIDGKLDTIISYASMAKGAGWIIFKIGAWLTAISGTIYTIVQNWRH